MGIVKKHMTPPPPLHTFLPPSRAPITCALTTPTLGLSGTGRNKEEEETHLCHLGVC